MIAGTIVYSFFIICSSFKISLQRIKIKFPKINKDCKKKGFLNVIHGLGNPKE